jgi:hypothetical protein
MTQSAATPEPVGGPDTDSIRSGDQTTPDSANASSGTAETPGSESAANSDGPGDHADAPGNPTADHQFQGVE